MLRGGMANQVLYCAVVVLLLGQEILVLRFGLAYFEKAHLEVALLLLQSVVLGAIRALFMGCFCKLLLLRSEVVLFLFLSLCRISSG